jgi:hypothetical protein
MSSEDAQADLDVLVIQRVPRRLLKFGLAFRCKNAAAEFVVIGPDGAMERFFLCVERRPVMGSLAIRIDSDISPYASSLETWI